MLLDHIRAKKLAIDHLVDQFGGKRLRVFGSVVRGDEGPDSGLTCVPCGTQQRNSYVTLTRPQSELTIDLGTFSARNLSLTSILIRNSASLLSLTPKISARYLMFGFLTKALAVSTLMVRIAFASDVVEFQEPIVPISVNAPDGVLGLSISVDSLGASTVDVKAVRHASTVGPETLSLGRSASSVNVYKGAAPSVVVVVSDEGFGSGVLISNSGDIVTNLHVVGASKTVAVVFKSEAESQTGGASSRRARVIKVDRKADLAVIRVDSFPPGVTPLRLGGVSEVMVGSDVHAIGHPTGNTWTYTRGYVSAIRRGFSWNERHEADVIQTQTPINPGNSGGPLLNNDGAVVGINSFKQSSSDGLNFAVAADHVRSLMLREGDKMSDLESNTKTCKESPRLRNSSRNEKDRSNVFLYDIDCDETTLFEIRVPDDKKIPTSWRFDRNRDKVIDVIVFDEGQDGTFDFSYHDVDFDRKWDLIGYHSDGKIKPTRFVKYKD